MMLRFDSVSFVPTTGYPFFGYPVPKLGNKSTHYL